MARITSSEPEKIRRQFSAFLASHPEFAWLAPYPDALCFTLTDRGLKIDFCHAYFADFYSKNCQAGIEQAIRACFGKTIVISYGSCVAQTAEKEKTGQEFSGFICSSKNEAALAALKTLCSSLEPDCPILVLRGASGTGKSLLLQEAAKALARTHGCHAPLYIRAAAFDQHERPESFWRKRYALLLDDLQDMAHDNERQKSLAACLDVALAEPGSRRVVIAFGGAEFSIFGPRLCQRLNQALMLDLYGPDLATRIAFTERESKRLELTLTKKQILDISRQIQKIPAISGILQKYKFYCRFDDQKLSANLLDNLPMPDRKTSGWQHILILVAENLALKPADILSKSRRQEFVLARQAAMFLCRVKLGLSYPELGRIFGGMDHSTVMHGIKKIQQLRVADKDLHNLLTKLEEEIS